MAELRVLLVDDNPEDLRYYAAILSSQGYDVRTCGSYTDATACLKCGLVDFVVVDQGTRAFEARAVLECAVQNAPHAPALVLARCLDIGCYLDAMETGAADYLEKPVPARDLLWVMETHLRRRHARSATHERA